MWQSSWGSTGHLQPHTERIWPLHQNYTIMAETYIISWWRYIIANILVYYKAYCYDIRLIRYHFLLGGYNITNAARCWTYLTSLILGCKIATDIPDNHVSCISNTGTYSVVKSQFQWFSQSFGAFQYFERYGPGFDLEVVEGNRPDCNSEDYIESCISIIAGICITCIYRYGKSYWDIC